MLALTEFGSAGCSRQDGTIILRSYCKECNSAKAIKWRKAHKERDTLRVAMRRKIAKQATPKYLTKEDFLPIYQEAKEKGLTVDHIIPLKHDLVCGLNVPWNLQLLSVSENSSKGNKFFL